MHNHYYPIGDTVKTSHSIVTRFNVDEPSETAQSHLNVPRGLSLMIQRTCAEDACKDPALSVAHGLAVGRDPLVQDVGAAAPLRGIDPTAVATLPLPVQNTHVIISVHLGEGRRHITRAFSLSSL